MFLSFSKGDLTGKGFDLQVQKKPNLRLFLSPALRLSFQKLLQIVESRLQIRKIMRIQKYCIIPVFSGEKNWGEAWIWISLQFHVGSGSRSDLPQNNANPDISPCR